MADLVRRPRPSRPTTDVWSASTAAAYPSAGIQIECTAVQMVGDLRRSVRASFETLNEVLRIRDEARRALDSAQADLREVRQRAEREFSAILGQFGEGSTIRPPSAELEVRSPQGLVRQVQAQASAVQAARDAADAAYESTRGLAKERAKRWMTSSLMPANRFVADTVEINIIDEQFDDGLTSELFIMGIADLASEGADSTFDVDVRDFLESQLLDFQVPVFGSPPQRFSNFGQLLAGGSYVGGFGSLIAGQGIWVAAASISMGVVLHITAPGIDNIAKKVDLWSAELLNLPPED